ncbi:MAG: hypothetical protein IK119_01925 [Bacteroidales bacterium]|jgi:hypothetical protein|nr:hypothetical protein [Bacteroidales bacterium]MBR3284850.1 hypothetical protein [Bacteroidales bacterium]MBR5431123.1 hypothetical protein [Bacteroidales bacterium]
MPTYRELFEKLGQLTPEQLDSEIRVFPLGYTDADSMMILNYKSIPEVLELTKAVRDMYHYKPSDEDADWTMAGIMDFSESEVQELGIAEDSDYTLVCKKGEIIFKLKDNIQLVPEMPADVGLDTGILPL